MWSALYVILPSEYFLFPTALITFDPSRLDLRILDLEPYFPVNNRLMLADGSTDVLRRFKLCPGRLWV